ncbi:FecR family protein [Solitalea sp. MAHUQ-68]|uniref:FecR family protein n=1 Tax=Solitalea agri TaxID=2953739 RepID=A0A9X2FA65_9SPHI|nr:FecR family protein [Solitalea agri]MCO4294738.1 FecR family protein [Solitalea agri]
MDKKLFFEIIDKFLKGKANPKEQELLFKQYDAFQKNGQDWDDSEHGEYEEVRTSIYERIRSEIDKKEKNLFNRHWAKIAIASCLLIACSLVVYFRNNNDILGNKVVSSQVIKPGGNEATLTLQDGSKVLLNAVNIGEIAQQGNIKITKTKDGQLVYTIAANNDNDGIQTESYNSIETPRGGQYQINLPDGSKVWLNAASSLKYPTVFKGTERKVELTGEGYFEIAKDKTHPFKVITQNQQVEVLGTHFNIDAYNDNGNTKTTLLEGSVKAGLINSSDSKTLKPGEQMIVNQQKISVIEVDTEEAIAWKNGYFMFNNESLETVMNKIARWYNIDIDYNGNKINKTFGGSISRFKNVKDVLSMLELTGSVHFKIEGRRVIVMP